jgi:O-antigen/teichoic acid export membrane protein
MSLHKKAGQLLFGTFIAQVITLLTLPILTKLVTPTEFGKYTQTLFLVATLLPFATMRLESLTVSVLDDATAIGLAKIGLISSTLLTLLFLPLFLMIAKEFSVNLVIGVYPFLVIAIALISQSFALILNQYNLRLKRYKKIMFGSVLQNSITSIFQILASIVNPIYEFLATSFAAGRFSVLIADTRKFKEILRFQLEINMIKSLVQRFWKSSLILITGAFFETFIFSGINVFVGLKYGQEIAGYLGLALLIFAVPGTLIGSSFTSVIFSEYNPKEKVNLKIKKILKTIVLISLTTSIFITYIFPEIARVFLSQEWSESISLISKLGIPIGINILWISSASIMYKNEEFGKYLTFGALRVLLSTVTASLFVAGGNSWQNVVLSYFVAGSVILLVPIFSTYQRLLKN